MHHSGYYNLVSLIFGTTIPTSFNILMKCFLHVDTYTPQPVTQDVDGPNHCYVKSHFTTSKHMLHLYVSSTIYHMCMYMQYKLTLDVVLVSTCSYTGQLVLFRCDERVKGGDSILVDGLAVLERLRHTHPQHFSTLARVPTNYHRIHYNRCRVHFILVYGSIPMFPMVPKSLGMGTSHP